MDIPTMSSSSENISDPGNPSALQTTPSEQNPRSNDPEKQAENPTKAPEKVSAFQSLGILDRFLALWIFLSMLIGILLGNFVPDTGPALQRGKFVGVSVPIGAFCIAYSCVFLSVLCGDRADVPGKPSGCLS